MTPPNSYPAERGEMLAPTQVSRRPGICPLQGANVGFYLCLLLCRRLRLPAKREHVNVHRCFLLFLAARGKWRVQYLGVPHALGRGRNAGPSASFLTHTFQPQKQLGGPYKRLVWGDISPVSNCKFSNLQNVPHTGFACMGHPDFVEGTKRHGSDLRGALGVKRLPARPDGVRLPGCQP